MDSQYDESIQAFGQNGNEAEEISQQFMNDAENSAEGNDLSEPDLPALPEDLTTLTPLQDCMAKVGMVIVFKHYELRGWQPELSGYVTAQITFVPEQGELGLSLAKRDRKTTEKTIDPSTGKRMYDKFEMPGDDDDDEEDDGQLFLTFSQLIEPRIVQEASTNFVEEAQQDPQKGGAQDSSDRDIDMGGPPKTTQADPFVIDDDAPPKEVPSADESTTLSHEQELPENKEDEIPEAQYSHVTETPLNSDAPESYEQDRQPDEDLEMSELPPQISPDQGVIAIVPDNGQHVGAADSQTVDPENGPGGAEEMQVEAPISQETPATPALGGNNEPPPDIDYLDEPVPEETRLKVARMMKDAGFRSNVPSSILRGPDGVQTPGEAASFERLLKQMTGTETNGDKENTADRQTQSQPYSPKFNGLGSSPFRQPRESSRTPTKARQLAPNSSSPTRPPSSSWETVDGDLRSSPPQQSPEPELEEEGQSSWVTVDQTQTQVQQSSPLAFETALAVELGQVSSPSPAADPAIPQVQEPIDHQAVLLKTTKEDSEKPQKTAPAKKVPIGKAQAYWEQWQARKRRRSSESDSDYEDAKTSTRNSPGRSQTSLDNAPDASVNYPKLSLNSSFTSQVTDHGHQPEADIEDTVLTVDSPVLPSPEPSILFNRPPQPNQRTNDKGKGKSVEAEIELPRTKVSSQFVPAPIKMPTMPSDDSSDDELPSLEVLSQVRYTHALCLWNRTN